MSHKHFEMIKTYYANPDWWCVAYKTPYGDWCLTSDPSWTADEYELRKSVKHPDNRPKRKLVDMSKLPRGTMTNCEELVGGCDDYGYFLQEESQYMQHVPWSDVRIAEQKTFTYWGGGECPISDGLVVEVKRRDGDVIVDREPSDLRWKHITAISDIIGYRILGVADGWTDDPALAAR